MLSVGLLDLFHYSAWCTEPQILSVNVEYQGLKGKSKSVPLQAWSGPEGSGKLRFPDFMAPAQESGKVVSLTHLPPGNPPGTHFC